MAAGAFRAGGAPGLFVTTLGPGLANMVNGIADAGQEGVPLIVLTGRWSSDRSGGRYTDQIINHEALLRPLVKASFEIESEGASEVVARALRLAMAPPFGPVHLDLPPSMAAEISAGREVASLYWTFPVAFDQWVSAPVRRGLERAQCPVIVARMDAPCPGVREPLTVLVERIDTPLS